MDAIVEFVKWCFKDANSGFATIIVLGILYQGTIRIIHTIKGTHETDTPDDD